VASGNGGGLLNEGRLDLVGTVLSDNVATVGGGGLANTGDVTLNKTVIVNNTASSDVGLAASGGGLYNAAGTVTVTHSLISSNTADYGGAIDNSGTLTITASILRGNTSEQGGGINQFGGSTTVIDSTLSDNTGIGIYVNGGRMAVAQSTLSGNAGGIYNDGYMSVTTSMLISNIAPLGVSVGGISNIGYMTLTDSTLSGNVSGSFGGGGIFNGGTLVVSYSTLAGNTTVPPGGGADINNYGGPLTLIGTIVSNTGSGESSLAIACSGPFTDGGYNLDTDGSCDLTQPTDIARTNPLLGPLVNNGGPTLTMALLPGSPAVDHGGTRATGCPSTDQRGLPRPDSQDGALGPCDIGAYESRGVQ
jgi:hypothetical protein